MRVAFGGSKRKKKKVVAGCARRTIRGFKFRRQHPMAHYFLDFYFPEARLSVERPSRAEASCPVIVSFSPQQQFSNTP
jgi:hypothetical protein